METHTIDSPEFKFILRSIRDFITNRDSPLYSPFQPIPVTPVQLKALYDLAARGDLHEFDRARIDYDGHFLLIKFSNNIEAVLPALIRLLKRPTQILQAGAADIRLRNAGRISPSGALYDHPGTSNQYGPFFNRYPTVIFELSVSESASELASNCKLGLKASRFIGGSGGAIQLVIVIKVDLAALGGNPNLKRLNDISVEYWEAVDIDILPEDHRAVLNKPRDFPYRCDDLPDNASVDSPPRALEYYYLTLPAEGRNNGKVRRLNIVRTENIEVMANGVTQPAPSTTVDPSSASESVTHTPPGHINISFFQLLRKVPNDTDPHAPAMSIPYTRLVGTLQEALDRDNLNPVRVSSRGDVFIS